ncbi:Uncharacterised protein [Salmonella bongori]|nr:Uncharacterised protein [Salmonella bongori]
MFRVQRAGTVGVDLRLWHQIQNSFIRQRYNFVYFMGCPETVKEMNKRDAAFQRSYMRDQRKILRFLNTGGA